MLKGIGIVNLKVLTDLFNVPLKSYCKRVGAQINKVTNPVIIQWYKIPKSYCEGRLRLYWREEGEVRAEQCVASREMITTRVSVEGEVTALFGGVCSLTQLN